MNSNNYILQTVRVIMIALLISVSNACDEKGEDIPDLAYVRTLPTVTNITEYTAESGGIVEKDGGAAVLSRGVCWNTTGNPTINDAHSSDGLGTGNFTSQLTELTPNTPYFVRAFAVNSVGASYGAIVHFETAGEGGVPHVISNTPLNVTISSADLGGKVTEQGGSAVTERGVCWALFDNPTIADNKQAAGSDTGSFVTTVSGLEANQLYYFRAYATNSDGTGYGNVKQFNTTQGGEQSCPGLAVLVDPRDGQTYPTVQIGSQCWMAKNLNIGTIIDSKHDQDPAQLQKWCYGDVSGNCDLYGGLYQWDQVMQGSTQIGVQGICPPSWHVPTDGEYADLTTFLGGYDLAGIKMKEAGYNHWLPPNTGATNESGFTALPGGYRYTLDSVCYMVQEAAYFWTSSGTQGNVAWVRALYNFAGYQERTALFRYDGGSLRCIKDD
jgi:uncharacterized protein (TIGR02145 family)